ncbi:unnamed protein product, partial [Pocillopora meandrina]
METWFWVLGWFLSILTMVVNGFVIFLVCGKRQLRTKTNAFVVSLAVADFSFGMIAVPSLFFCSLATECTPRSKEGLIVTFVRVFILYISGTNLVSLVLERYVAVVKPLKYLTFMKHSRVIQMLRTAIKKKFNVNVVLGSRLVLLHHHDGCKWICHLPRLQSTSASHQNQSVGVITAPSHFFCNLTTEC